MAAEDPEASEPAPFSTRIYGSASLSLNSARDFPDALFEHARASLRPMPLDPIAWAALSIVPCPRCRRVRLVAPSDQAEVDCHRCDECGLVWNVPKDGEPTVTIVAAPPWPSA